MNRERKIWLIIAGSVLALFVVYYLVMSVSAVNRTVNEFDNEYYVLGDNRNSSKDSRSFGPVNDSYITGRVLLRGWPFDRIKLFEAPQYSF